MVPSCDSSWKEKVPVLFSVAVRHCVTSRQNTSDKLFLRTVAVRPMGQGTGKLTVHDP